jgi:hypothetical protein
MGDPSDLSIDQIIRGVNRTTENDGFPPFQEPTCRLGILLQENERTRPKGSFTLKQRLQAEQTNRNAYVCVCAIRCIDYASIGGASNIKRVWVKGVCQQCGIFHICIGGVKSGTPVPVSLSSSVGTSSRPPGESG